MRHRLRFVALAGLAATSAIPFLSTPQASALSGSIPASTLKTACETSPLNTVNMLDTVIVGGIANVATKCIINIPESKSLEFIGADVNFAGALTINGAPQTKVEIVLDSRIRARTGTFNFAGQGGQLKVDASQLGTTVGALRLTMGDNASLQVSTPSIFGYNIDSVGGFAMTSGVQSFTTFNTASVRAGGVVMAMNGVDSSLLSESTTFATRTAAQSIVISSAAAKASVTLTATALNAGNNATVNLTGTESSIKGTGSQATGVGNVTLAASMATGKGIVEWVGPNAVLIGRRVLLDSSSTSQFGAVKVLDAALAASGASTSDVLVRTGAIGNTEVVESTLSATRAVRITSNAATGQCKQEGNLISAPIQQLC